MTREEFVALATRIACMIAMRFEGLFLAPYLCPAGVPTIGYGATYYEDGRRVTLRDPAITKDRAWGLLLWMVQTVYLPAVLRLCPRIDTPQRLAAIVDFAFNLGVGQLKISTLRRRINAERWDQVPFELRKWIIAGGKKLKGLILRREAEVAYV